VLLVVAGGIVELTLLLVVLSVVVTVQVVVMVAVVVVEVEVVVVVDSPFSTTNRLSQHSVCNAIAQNRPLNNLLSCTLSA